jgi:hypothetical protein
MKTNSLKRFGTLLISFTLLLAVNLKSNAQIARDKQLHLGAGAVVAGWGSLIPQNNKGWKPFVYGVGSATIAGVGKELTDMGGFGTPDIRDLGATVIGGLVSAGIITGIKAIIKRTSPTRRRVLFAQRPQPQVVRY